MGRPLIRAGWVGVAVIILSVSLLCIFPARTQSNIDGLFTPIIAFEFIQTSQEVYQLFGSQASPERDAMVRAMDRGNHLDFAYMILYSFFLFTFSVLGARESGIRVLYLGTALSVVILLGDFFENIQLLGITANLATGDFEEELRHLPLFTWQKWGGIAAIFLLLFAYFRRGTVFSRIIGTWGVVTALLAIVSFLNRSVVNEVFSLAVALQFLLMIIFCFTHRAKISPEGFHNP